MQAARNPVARNLPSWEQLSAPVTTDTPEFARAVKRLQQNLPTGPYRFARFVVTTMLRDPSYQKMLDFAWPDIIDMMADQVRRNKQLASEPVSETPTTAITARTNNSISRPHSQMPCTPETTQKRVAKISSLIPKSTPVLLLGDDDLVSVDLALAGFTDVTAVDICPKVLGQISRTSQDHDLGIKVAQHDLSKPAPSQLRRPYGLVSFDPQYSIAGVKLFLDAAMDFSGGLPGTQLLVCLHLMSLSRRGLPALEQLFAQAGVEIREFEQGFNTYPAPKRLKGLIHLANRIVIGSNILSTEGYSFPYLLSDMLLLRKT